MSFTSEAIVFFFPGCFVTWLVSWYYFRKSFVHAPEWAKEMIERLSKDPPSDTDLVKVFEDALKNTTVDGGNF